MPKERVTVYLDADVLRAMRVKAARAGKKDSEVVEDALREHLLMGVLERIWSHAPDDLGEDEALELAVSEQHDLRAGR